MTPPDPIARYLDANQGRLSKEDEQELGQLIQAGHRAREQLADADGKLTDDERAQLKHELQIGTQACDELVRRGLRIGISEARRKGIYNLDVDDRIQAASIGLIDAANKFDPTKGRFSTFATQHIRGRLSEASREQPHLVHVPKYARTAWSKIQARSAERNGTRKSVPCMGRASSFECALTHEEWLKLSPTSRGSRHPLRTSTGRTRIEGKPQRAPAIAGNSYAETLEVAQRAGVPLLEAIRAHDGHRAGVAPLSLDAERSINDQGDTVTLADLVADGQGLILSYTKRNGRRQGVNPRDLGNTWRAVQWLKTEAGPTLHLVIASCPTCGVTLGGCYIQKTDSGWRVVERAGGLAVQLAFDNGKYRHHRNVRIPNAALLDDKKRPLPLSKRVLCDDEVRFSVPRRWSVVVESGTIKWQGPRCRHDMTPTTCVYCNGTTQEDIQEMRAAFRKDLKGKELDRRWGGSKDEPMMDKLRSIGRGSQDGGSDSPSLMTPRGLSHPSSDVP